MSRRGESKNMGYKQHEIYFYLSLEDYSKSGQRKKKTKKTEQNPNTKLNTASEKVTG